MLIAHLWLVLIARLRYKYVYEKMLWYLHL